MSPLIETLRLEDGSFRTLDYHAARMRRAWNDLFQIDEPWKLHEVLERHPLPQKGLYKCRVTYDQALLGIELVPYELRTIHTLKIVENDHISYEHKFRDRRELESLFNQRAGCDDVLIVRNGKVTDTSFANIAFKKDDRWFTPSSCLLPGTARAGLIDQSVIQVTDITIHEIPQYESFRLINSMLLWDGPEVPVSGITR